MKTGWNLENTYADLPADLFVRQAPVPVAAPSLVRLNVSLADDLGLDPDTLRSPEGVAILAGNALPPGSLPIAQAYAGHQFGHFTMLGDGRAILLGEQVDPTGRRRDIQLKGSGRTPFSRNGDGRAALKPMLREFVIGEAMHALGIPTSRSLAVTATGESVYRQDGELPGAVLVRVAASHIRVGTFEYAASRGSRDLLLPLAAYTLKRHAPDSAESPKTGAALLAYAVRSQADLVASWMHVGFIHGVMNTDNMFLSGETADFGPCAFMEAFDPAAVFSSIDSRGRYSYGNQPAIAHWNLHRLAEALLPILGPDEGTAIARAEELLAAFEPRFHEAWLDGMRIKLGIADRDEADERLVTDLLAYLHRERLDFTNAFLDLENALAGRLASTAPPSAWFEEWKARLMRDGRSTDDAIRLMQSRNPRVIPRNHLVERALDAAAAADWAPWETLLEAVKHPFADHPLHASHRAAAPPEFTIAYRTFCGT